MTYKPTGPEDLDKRIDGRDAKGGFVKGHGCSPETRAKISAAKRANPCSPPCWMKGLSKESDERVARMAAAKTGKKLGPRPGRQGIRCSLETEFKKGFRSSMSTEFKKGQGTGEDNPMWKGGVTSEHDKIRKGKEYKEWRNAVYQRDKYHCQICKKHCAAKDIIAHHINSFSVYAHLRFVIENGVTLCRSCHIKLHKAEEIRLCG